MHLRKQQTKQREPLAGVKIVITRAQEQAGKLRQALAARGATVLELPTIALAPPHSFRPLDAAIRRLARYAWVIFTSTNGVEQFFSRLARWRKNAPGLRRIKIAAIGPATAQALRRHGVKPRIVPREFRAEGLVQALARERWAGQRVLLARAAKAREVLPQALQRKGAKVDVIAAYRTVLPTASRHAARRLFAKERPDLITFTSSSTARNFARLLGRRQARRALRGVAIAVIGPVTAATVREWGWPVAVSARPYTISGLVKAIVRYWGRRRRPSSGR